MKEKVMSTGKDDNLQTLPLHRKYRPQSFEEVIGNKALLNSLTTVIEKNVTTFLFQGPSGCGKTTIARIVAKQLGATDRDIKELNISDTRGIDAARSIIENARFKPFGGKAKVYVLDECHRSTTDFQNAMLKILEEPPKNTYFILCTTEPDKLLKTIRNRCTPYQVRTLTYSESTILIKHVIIEERRRKFPKEAIREIAFAADGCPRDCLKILDSVIDIEDDEKLIQAIQDFSLEKKEVIDLCRALLAKKKWKEVSGLIKLISAEPENTRYAVLGYMASVLLNKPDDRVAFIIEEFKESFMYTKKAGLVSACYAVCHISE